jgi:translation initiation factor 4E
MQAQNKIEKIPAVIPQKDYLLTTPWVLWYHHELDNWKTTGYRKIFTINTIKDFWDLHHNIEYIGGINNQNFFLMRNGIDPIWEDPKNRSGGCWSIKLTDTSKNYNTWLKLAMRMVGENMFKDPKQDEQRIITGLSINLRNSNTTIIKIWNGDTRYNSIKLLQDDITKDFGYNIIYKKNNVEY